MGERDRKAERERERDRERKTQNILQMEVSERKDYSNISFFQQMKGHSEYKG